MNKEIKCPKCGEVFKVDEAMYDSIVSQIKSKEFNEELAKKLHEQEQTNKLISESKYNELKNQSELALANEKANQMKVVNDLNNQIAVLNNKLALASKEKELALLDNESKNKAKTSELENKLIQQKSNYDSLLQAKETEIAFYKDMKTKLSTKMIGETLEQHCKAEFERIRPILGKNVTFEKDNDTSINGEKGDFIYKEVNDEGNEVISIMFEMKNECDTTSTKIKNEHFFKKLDSDRNTKGCEYAVLVSLLESDSDTYNAGITDVSHFYDKMYVVRPQCFIPIITTLRNAALKSMSYKNQLVELKHQQVDVENFESHLKDFKDDFSRNVRLATDKFEDAIKEIDKTIAELNKVKENLLSSGNNLRIANNKAVDLTIKKLVKDSPTLKEKFDEVK